MIQADGGIRTALITGAYVVLKMVVDSLRWVGRIKSNLLIEVVAVVLVGLKGDQILVDLDYSEDSMVDFDMNVVLI